MTSTGQQKNTSPNFGHPRGPQTSSAHLAAFCAATSFFSFLILYLLRLSFLSVCGVWPLRKGMAFQAPFAVQVRRLPIIPALQDRDRTNGIRILLLRPVKSGLQRCKFPLKTFSTVHRYNNHRDLVMNPKSLSGISQMLDLSISPTLLGDIL